MFLLVACGSLQHMEMVGQDVREGRFIPAQNNMPADVLNQYAHQLPIPMDEAMGLHLMLENQYVMDTGGRALIMAGISTSKPRLQETQLHILLYDEGIKSTAKQKKILSILQQVEKTSQAYEEITAFTVDTAFSSKHLALGHKSLLSTEKNLSLKKFMQRYISLSLSGDTHHFLVILGEHTDLEHDEKQQVLDIVNILSARGYTASLMSIAGAPDFSFLEKFSENAKGATYIVNTETNMAQLVKNDLLHVSAAEIKDITLRLNFKNNVILDEVISPGRLSYHSSGLEIHIPSLRFGNEHVLLAEIVLPEKTINNKLEIASLTSEYYLPDKNRYYSEKTTAEIQYTNDKNLTLINNDRRIKKSKVILDTFSTLEEVEQFIRMRRPYQAVALLTKQITQLNKQISLENDALMQRDRDILSEYSNRLLEFPDESFQWFKIKSDLQWDRQRYSRHYH